MPNDVAVNTYSASFVDRDAEKSSLQVNIAAFADNPAYVTARTDFETAIDTITNGVRYRREASLPELVASQAPPNNNAFREDKWLIRYEDTVTFRRYSFTVPTADPTGLTLIPGTDNLDLAVGAGAAIKSDTEAFVISPAGNPVNVYEVSYVGRNI